MTKTLSIHPDGTIEFSIEEICQSVGKFLNFLFRRNSKVKESFLTKKSNVFNDITEELLESGELSHVEYWKSKNLLSIAKKADEYYSKRKKNSSFKTWDTDGDFNTNFEWWLRFYEASSLSFNETLKDIWAKIMANYIEDHKSASINLLKTISSLSESDVKLFKKVCQKSIFFSQSAILLNDDGYLSLCPFKYEDLLDLDGLGLINSAGLLNISTTIKAKDQWSTNNNSFITFVKNNTDDEFIFKVYNFPFTKIGNTLIKLLDIQPGDDSVIYFSNFLKNKYPELDISCHRVNKMLDNKVLFDDEDILIND